MSRFWLYLGIILVCSGIGTGIGILLVIFYFWEDIKKSLQGTNHQEQQNMQENLNPKFYDDDTVEEMR
jgi:uncharacterized membrane protein